MLISENMRLVKDADKVEVGIFRSYVPDLKNEKESRTTIAKQKQSRG